MNQKTLSIISYITIMGWAVAYFGSKNETRGKLLIKHLEQSLGLSILSIFTGIVISFITMFVPFLAILSYLNLIFFALIILGVINAANERISNIPIVGNLFEGKFVFLRN
ncbi:hypothetical protein GCM10023210_32670 [Chryseobacterium ginsengisoli]|uniref:Import component protein n=1 Tax=Chryseobacterium ginsengisoli TaxID=363853 RepID=A0ABP9MMX4_9FLAO